MKLKKGKRTALYKLGQNKMKSTIKLSEKGQCLRKIKCLLKKKRLKSPTFSWHLSAFYLMGKGCLIFRMSSGYAKQYATCRFRRDILYVNNIPADITYSTDLASVHFLLLSNRSPCASVKRDTYSYLSAYIRQTPKEHVTGTI